MNIALILASGNGARMGLKHPKQFEYINGRPMMFLSVETFQNNRFIDQIVLVTNKEYISQVTKWCVEYKYSKVVKVVAGGQTRRESVENGLNAISAKEDDLILIHDSARALVSDEIITRNIEAGQKYDAIATIWPTNDTIAVVENDQIINVPDRSKMFSGQTPQTFKFGLIKQAHDNCPKDLEITEDSRLVLMMGCPVHCVLGSNKNFKVTTPEDLELLKILVKH